MITSLETASADDIAAKLDDAKVYAKQKGLVIFNGSWVGGDEKISKFLWSTDNPDVKQFIDVALALGAKVLFVDSQRLEEDDLNDILDSIDQVEEDEEVEQIRKEIQSLSVHVNDISEISLQFKLGDGLYVYEEETDWSKRLGEIEGDVQELIEEQEVD